MDCSVVVRCVYGEDDPNDNVDSYQLTKVVFIGLNTSISSRVYWHGLFIVS